DDVGDLPAVAAAEAPEIVDRAMRVDIDGKRPAAEVRPAGVVDHEVARLRRIGIVVARARDRLPQERRIVPGEPKLTEQRGERLALRQAGRLADTCRERAWQGL